MTPQLSCLPLASVVAVFDARQRYVAVLCPFCGARHHHGWPWTDRRVGSRRAHCGRGAYRVVGEWLGAR